MSLVHSVASLSRFVSGNTSLMGEYCGDHGVALPLFGADLRLYTPHTVNPGNVSLTYTAHGLTKDVNVT